jgi:CheY-like chemotaxis protein
MNPQLETSVRPMTILVADDDDDMRSLVAETLRTDGYRVVEAADGAELVEYLRTALDDPSMRPDVVVTDVLMPKLSGLGVLTELRRAQWGVPVIVITVLADDSVRSAAERLGAVAILKKPFDADDFRTAILNAGAVFTMRRASIQS